MRLRVLYALFVPACAVQMLSMAGAADRPAADPDRSALFAPKPAADLSAGPALFTANRGQWPDSVLYRAAGMGATLWFTRTGVYFQLSVPTAEESPNIRSLDPALRDAPSADAAVTAAPKAARAALIKMEFVAANPHVPIAAEGEFAFRSNYFLGNDPAQWRADVPNYARIVYRDLYPGVDVEFSGAAGQPGCRIATAVTDGPGVQVRFSATGAVAVDAEGVIGLDTESGRLKCALPSGLCLTPLDDGTYSVQADDPRPLGSTTASPAGLNYSTFIGGSLDDRARAIAIDASGNAYVAGYTSSANFPTKTPYQSDQGSADAFVLKLGAPGNSLVYATYLGGTGGDAAAGIAINAAGNAYVAGSTSSTNFPTVGPYQTHQGADDAFVVKLALAGNSLIYGTYIGGSGLDNAAGLALNDSGNAFVVGTTGSTNFPTVNAYQADQAGNDVFVVKVSVAGNSLTYATYVGGSAADLGAAIALNGAGNAFVTGTTSSTNFPTAGPYQTDKVADDAFVIKLSAAGNALVYGTYLGGSGADAATGIAVDGAGNAFVTGSTTSVDFPTKNAYQLYQGDFGFYDAFVVKLNATGNGLVYGTYLAGTMDDRSYAISIDDAGNAYVAGATWSSDFPMVDADGVDMDTTDAFAAKLSPTGTVLLYSTYLGGTYPDQALATAANDSASFYVAGYTQSPDFPSQNSYQAYLAGQDAFVAKLFTGSCPITMTGDVNSSGTVSSADIISLVNFVFKGGAHPQPCDAAGDVNCSGSVSSADIIFLVNHVFKGAAAPCDACGSSLAGGC